MSKAAGQGRSLRKYLQVIAIACIIVACKSSPNGHGKDPGKRDIRFSDKYLVCDTCKTVILIHHDECTSCGELSVDSGVVYIPNSILRMIDTLKDPSDRSDTAFVSHDYISLHELYLAKASDGFKLWRDTINYSDLYRAYRLVGKIVDVRHRVLSNGVVEGYPVLFFDMEKAEEIDTAYLSRLNEKMEQ